MQLAKSLGLASGWCFEREGNWRNQNPTAPRIAPDLNRTTTLRIRVVPPGTELHKLQHTKPLPQPYSHPHCIHRIVLHRTADIKHGGGRESVRSLRGWREVEVTGDDKPQRQGRRK